MTEYRTLRERARAFDVLLDRAQADHPPFVTARKLVQVFAEATIPTDPDKFYACHPVEMDGDETEGAGYTPVVDTDVILYVDVLGQAAVAGDLLVAHAVGGRWVAEKRGGTGLCYAFDCGSCRIPKADLLVEWTNSIIGDGSATLVWDGNTAVGGEWTWESECTNGVVYQLKCVGTEDRGVEFRVIYYGEADCPDGALAICSTIGVNPLKLNQLSLQCGLTFDLEVEVTDESCPALREAGYTGFSITWPDPPACQLCLSVYGFCDGLLAGATVTISGVGTGVTNFFGLVVFDIGAPGTFNVSITAPGVPSYSEDLFLKCGNKKITIGCGIPTLGTLHFTAVLSDGTSCTRTGQPARFSFGNCGAGWEYVDFTVQIGCADGRITMGIIFGVFSPIFPPPFPPEVKVCDDPCLYEPPYVMPYGRCLTATGSCDPFMAECSDFSRCGYNAFVDFFGGGPPLSITSITVTN